MRILRQQPRKRKQRLAWSAYLELTDAAHWIEAKLRTPLDVFGISREEFRLMVMLHRDGRLQLSEAEEKLRRRRENLYETIAHAEEFGWVRRGTANLPTTEIRESQLAKKQRGRPRRGREVGTVELTAEGERLIGKVLPTQEGMLRVLMAGLDAREMRTLIRACRKIRQEDEFTKVRLATELIRAGEEFARKERDGDHD